ncbi:uncharacterized protein LOC105845517 isoform X3 [Hydra vulgaris]|uniref:Uncharacterized protein LOC105845517 isoform X3 n=1 Tax=Hydra vulgaris TaxID=6087 RepID=A0ABM4B535_HYDVU
MKMRLVPQLFCIYFVSVVLAKDVCKKITTFNEMCQQGSAVFVLSATPCLSYENFQPLSISIYNQENQMFLHKNVVKHKEYYDLGNISVAVKWDWVIKSDSINYHHKLYLKAILYSVAKTNQTASLKRIVEVDFPFFFSMCIFDLHPHAFSPHICNESYKIGAYAYVCLIKNEMVSKHTPRNGLYFLMFDSCTIPFSTVVLAFYNQNKEPLKQLFTQDKSDAFLSTYHDGCGLYFQMNRLHMDIYRTSLNFACENNGMLVTLIEGFFNTELSLNCPLTKCIHETNAKHVCQNKWILGKNQSVLAFMNLTIEICADIPQVFLDMHVVNSEVHGNKIFPFHQTLKPNYLNTNDRIYSYPFHIGPLTNKNPSSNDGYLYFGGGNISLNILENTNAIFVLILGHFPNSRDGVPLLLTEFHVSKKNICPCETSESKNNSPMKVAIFVLVVIISLLVLVAFIIYCRKRIWRKNYSQSHTILVEE